MVMLKWDEELQNMPVLWTPWRGPAIEVELDEYIETVWILRTI
jgi:hypothetical protein